MTPSPADDTGPRRIVGRYRLEHELGRGAMGTVWSAYDEVLHRAVAVKEVRLSLVPVGERAIVRERTLREARATAMLSHPNVVTLYDVVEVGAEPYVVMELLPSRSLASYIGERGTLEQPEAAEIGSAVASALTTAHRAGITHRDVKPGNVLIGENGQIKLTDFGIARNAAEQSMTQTGTVLGSPPYIAPEVAMGRAVGPAADLWGLGATLFACIEGRPPYDAGDPVTTVTEVVHGEVPRPAGRGPVVDVIRGLMVKDPALRMPLAAVRRRLRPLLSDPEGPILAVAPAPRTAAFRLPQSEQDDGVGLIPAAGPRGPAGTLVDAGSSVVPPVPPPDEAPAEAAAEAKSDAPEAPAASAPATESPSRTGETPTGGSSTEDDAAAEQAPSEEAPAAETPATDGGGSDGPPAGTDAASDAEPGSEDAGGPAAAKDPGDAAKDPGDAAEPTGTEPGEAAAGVAEEPGAPDAEAPGTTGPAVSSPGAGSPDADAASGTEDGAAAPAAATPAAAAPDEPVDEAADANAAEVVSTDAKATDVVSTDAKATDVVSADAKAADVRPAEVVSTDAEATEPEAAGATGEAAEDPGTPAAGTTGPGDTDTHRAGPSATPGEAGESPAPDGADAPSPAPAPRSGGTPPPSMPTPPPTPARGAPAATDAETTLVGRRVPVDDDATRTVRRPTGPRAPAMPTPPRWTPPRGAPAPGWRPAPARPAPGLAAGTGQPLAADPGPLPFAPGRAPAETQSRPPVLVAAVIALLVLLAVLGAVGGYALTRSLAGQGPLAVALTPAGPEVADTRLVTHDDTDARYSGTGLDFSALVPVGWQQFRLQGAADDVAVRFVSPDATRELRIDRIAAFYPAQRATDYATLLGQPASLGVDASSVAPLSPVGAGAPGVEGPQQTIYRTLSGASDDRTTWARLVPAGTDLWVVRMTAPTADLTGGAEQFQAIADSFAAPA